MKLRNLLALIILFVVGLQSIKAQEAYAVYTSENETLTFYYDNLRSSRGSSFSLNAGADYPGWTSAYRYSHVVFDPSFADARPTTTYAWFFKMEYIESITGLNYLNTSEVTNMKYMFGKCWHLTSLDLSHFDTSKVTDMSEMFSNCTALTSLDLSNFDTSEVRFMSFMFDGCSSLESLDLSSFNTSNVQTMYAMFKDCTALKSLDLHNFDTSNVTEMRSMFLCCEKLTSLDLSNFNTSNIKSMKMLFSNCNSLKNLDVSHFDTSNVTDMRCMFKHCESLTSLDLSNFNTSQVTDMSDMFSACQSLTSLDLSSFNTSNVTGMYAMFYDCRDLTTIYVSDEWTTEKIETSRTPENYFMFTGCENLVGSLFTTYDINHNGMDYAHIDGGPDNPGYLSGYTFGVEGIQYRLVAGNTIEVTRNGSVGYTGEIIIPATVEYKGKTYSVTAIGESAFCDCTGLTGVTIPSSITEIGENAFNGCTNLTQIKCGSITPPTIYSNTFSNYSATLLVPNGFRAAYQAANYWKNFNIEEMARHDFMVDGIYYKDIGGRGFAEVTYKDTEYNTYSGTVEIPENVYSPENGMYYLVTTIGERAFYRCPYLQHLTLPATIDRIESEAFVDAFLDASNSDITCLATTPPTISPYAFGSEINDLTLYVLKDCKAAYMAHNVWKNFGNIVELPYHFQDGKVFYAITGANTVSVVHRNPSYNSYWGQVTIPSTVKHKGTTYTVTEIGNVAFLSSSQLTRVIIPSTVTRIGNRTFKDCPLLTSITIPENVTSIGTMCFNGCDTLTDITCLSRTPPSILYDTFTESHYQGANLYVPSGCESAYRFANVWELFSDVFELPAQKGDTNLDGAVDIADVTAVLSAMANGLNDDQYKVNDDDVVDIADVTAILTIMAGQ